MQYAFAVCGSLLLAACASKYSQIPARLDLASYGRIALVTFAADRPNDPMSTLATQQFAEALLANQNGVELLELGLTDSSLKALPPATDAVALAQAPAMELALVPAQDMAQDRAVVLAAALTNLAISE